MPNLYLAQAAPEAVAILALLKDAGGYGIAVALVWVVRFLWREVKAQEKKVEERDARIFTLLDKQNEILKRLEGRD